LSQIHCQEKFEDTKGVIRSCDRQQLPEEKEKGQKGKQRSTEHYIKV
jgi:hypothetical protein